MPDTDLNNILKNDFSVASAFANHLKASFQDQFLEFWLKVEEYKQLSDNEREATGKEIYREFFDDKSAKFMNMDEIFTLGLEQGVSKNIPNCFDKPQRAAWKILTQSFVGWQATGLKKSDCMLL